MDATLAFEKVKEFNIEQTSHLEEIFQYNVQRLEKAIKSKSSKGHNYITYGLEIRGYNDWYNLNSDAIHDLCNMIADHFEGQDYEVEIDNCFGATYIRVNWSENSIHKMKKQNYRLKQSNHKSFWKKIYWIKWHTGEIFMACLLTFLFLCMVGVILAKFCG